MSAQSPPLIGTPPDHLSGQCARCQCIHEFRFRPELGAQAMRAWWDELHCGDSVLGPQLHEAGGKMIAVLVAENETGETEISRAISGDLFGNPHVEGCVPPVIQHARFADLEARTLGILADLRARYEKSDDSEERATCVRQRREASRVLMKAILDTTTLCNRGGLELPVPEVFVGAGIPSGTADCALPKLLHRANRQGLSPKGIAEVWFGPPLGERVHGKYAIPCQIRCVPILGHLLCDAHV